VVESLTRYLLISIYSAMITTLSNRTGEVERNEEHTKTCEYVEHPEIKTVVAVPPVPPIRVFLLQFVIK